MSVKVQSSDGSAIGRVKTIVIPASNVTIDGKVATVDLSGIDSPLDIGTTKLKDDSGTLSVRNSGDSADAPIKASDGTFTGTVAIGTAGLRDNGGTLEYRNSGGEYLPVGSARVNDIGIPGRMGFGVGICPPSILPAGMSPLVGYSDPTHPNYGNYQYSDGSVMVWIPKYWYKVGTGSNGLAVNAPDIKGIYDFADTTAANAASYALHRSFIDGGVEQPGFFVDKYKNSKVAKGSGWVGASVKNGNPISTHADHNPISALSAVSLGNIYASALQAPKGRTGTNGALDATSIFHCASRFQYAALALLALAHGQAAASIANCAWWQSGKAYPKGCNDNALRDTDDTSLLYVTDGYSNCGKTGSGTLFAKTTHNGQDCGVADVNGLMWEISIGATCIAASKTITGATQASPCVITIDNHGYTTGDILLITSVGGMTQLNDKLYTITVIDTNTFSLNGVNSTAYGEFTSGGSATKGSFYVAKDATRMRDFTPGNSLATDHWGATGVAAMMDAFSPPLLAASGGSALGQRFGSGSNQVLSEATSGAGRLLAGLGIPKDTTGFDGTGTDLFGKDYYYQYIRNELCLISCGSWFSGADAGVWDVRWSSYRTNSSTYVGFRAACYLV